MFEVFTELFNVMAAPLKPWERAGVNSRAFGGDIGNTLPTPIVRCVINFLFSQFVFVKMFH